MARIAILTASDGVAAGTRVDEGGALIDRRCREEGHEVVATAALPDDRQGIADQLAAWCDAGAADLILTTGGTGLTPRDLTPEATRDIAERDVPGIPLAIAQEGLKHTSYAILSRGAAVTRGKTLIVNLPGSPKGVADGLSVLLPLVPHIAELVAGPVEHDG
ncbi:MAG: MogA/MoaB family molybdenum cofactor biosynthesis protein [Chloroflexota bacterium]|nr:MogA/MoaB family molybdenum cofactor biosynthesis protein [Chloroflexota bacterium]